MNWQKRFYNLVFSFGLGAGVLFAQLCNVICLAANCTEKQPVVSETSPSHCHSSQTPTSPAPQPDSHNCQTHDLTLLLAASEAKSGTAVQMDWQPIAILPAHPELIFSLPRMERVRLSALRSPPRLPQRQILRI